MGKKKLNAEMSNANVKCFFKFSLLWPFYARFFSLSRFITDIRPVFELKIIDHEPKIEMIIKGCARKLPRLLEFLL